MTKRLGWLIAVAALSGLAACGGGGGPDPVGPECTSDDNCAAQKFCSASGTCTAFPNPGVDCNRAVDCASPKTCQSHVCTAPAPTCTLHTDCPAQQYCGSASTCVPETTPGTTCHKVADCGASQACTNNLCVGTGTAECDKAANVAKKNALIAAQPVIKVGTGTGHKAKLTTSTTFASVAGDPSVQCSVSLDFKDASGDAALQPYEDWTKGAAVRAADLASRMTTAQKLALLAHASLSDTISSATPSAGTLAIVDAGIRFGQTTANTAGVGNRATWANAIQERAEAATWGVPFVLSSEAAHQTGNGRVKANRFTQWPNELALGATGDLALVENYGKIVAKEYRAIGITMALSVPADLATDPRLQSSQFTFGEDSASVSAMAAALVKGLQGTALSSTGVAAVVGHFPGAGPAADGFDARLSKGKYYGYSTKFDDHVNAFQGAFGAGVAGVMTGYGVPKQGAWTGLSGAVNGSTIEQVASSYNSTIVTSVLRNHFSFGGLVLAPAGILNDAGVAPLGAPWGMEGSTKAQRIAKAVGAGVDQFLGVNATTDLAAAGLSDAQVTAAATHVLAVTFQLGLFENPYVDAALAPTLVGADTAFQAGLDAMNRGMVLLVNKDKPAGWLNGDPLKGDGHQTGDKGNAGNGTMKVLPAPPGEPYVAAGCDYFISGDFDLDYVRSVSAGYGTMNNDAPKVKEFTISSDPVVARKQRLALSDYVLVRIAAPFAADSDAGALSLPTPALTYGATDATVLAPVQEARDAITWWATNSGGGPASQAQIVVFVDAGRPLVVSELQAAALGISGLYIDWMGILPANQHSDKVAMDVAFGIVNGRGKLPVGLPASDATAGSQLPDVAGDGQDATLVRGFGIQTNSF
ncbi:MAG: glycoside hydrolase family 3 N-terminal domain-containing protein [Anaeromyxobacteraceae bacterium]